MRIQKRYLTGALLLAIGILCVIPVAVHAQVSLDLPGSFAGFSSQDLKTTIQNIVRIVLGFIGVIFLLLILFAGFRWMTSRGDEKQIMQAKKILVSAVIGLIITLGAYAIAGFIIRSFTGATGPGGGAGGPGSGPGGFGFALGSGALESHYPGRNARNIPRNTNIFVTFKEEMDISTICDAGSDGTYGTPDDLVNVANVRILDLNDAVNPDDPNDANPDDNILDTVSCAATDATDKTFKFDPAALLGTGNGDVVYNVILTRNILTADGESALPLDYAWRFTVNSVVDETPPTVISVYPSDGDIVSRNSIVQINFSEPVDPSLASGLYAPNATPPSTYDQIILDLSDPAAAEYIEGSYVSGNQYMTTEFVSNESCGTNSCGENVFCLPGAQTIYGFVSSGITDMAGNMLDGDNDGSAGGVYRWQFQTTDEMDLTPPVMMTRRPGSGGFDWPLGDPIELDFSKQLSATSLRSSNVGLGRIEVPYTPPGESALANEGNYWITKEDLNLDADPELETRVYIQHDILKPLTPYHPGADSEIKDVHQNCYFPATCSPGPC